MLNISKMTMMTNIPTMTMVALIVLFTMSIFWQPSFAEEIPSDVAEKRYKPKLDQATNEHLSPLKQLGIGILAHHIICFDEKIPILKWTQPLSVACVNQDTAQKLQIRDWGITKTDKSKFNQNPPVGESRLYWKIYPSSNVNGDFANNLVESMVIKHMRKSIHSISEHTAWMKITISDGESDSFMMSTGAANLNEQERQMIIKEMVKNHAISKIEFLSELAI